MDITSAYERTWRFSPPRKCREMHAAKLFEPRGKSSLQFAVFELSDGDEIAEGDAFVSELLVPGLVPIGGDSSGDRWCFDTRRRIRGTTPVLMCPHDGGGARYVAPSFAGFVYRLVLEGLVLDHIFAGRGTDRDGLRKLTRANLVRIDRWLLRRWARRAQETLDGTWPTYDAFDTWMRKDPAFRAMPRGEISHFR